jgi:hypothetical protein
MVAIIVRPSKRERVTYNEMREGRMHTLDKGRSVREAEVAIRDHLDGATPAERRKEYDNHFRKKY